MDFSGLKYSYKRWETNGEPIQNKQRLNISEYAKSVLLNDSAVFLTQSGSNPEEMLLKQKPSSFLVNHIFRCFRYDAHASVAYTLMREKNRLSEVLFDMDQNQRKIAIDALLSEKQSSLNGELNQFRSKKGFSFTINLDKNNIEYLVSDEGQRESIFYADSVGDYIKTVLEEYAELSFSERELVFCRDIMKEIQNGLEQRKVLKLYLRGNKSIHGEIRRNVVYIKPYGVFRDTEQLYNYLVGWSNTDHGTEWSMTSIRLSSICRCDCLSDSGIIHKKEESQILDGIRMRGVQYLSEKNQMQKIVVRLDDEGERMYHRLLHLRPTAVNYPEPSVYEFACTVSQAEFYFFKFGHHAVILEPRTLAEKFERKYQSALRIYQKDCQKT